MRNIFIIIVFIIVNLIGKAQNIPEILKDFESNQANSILPDFSYAGYQYGNTDIPDKIGKTYSITDFGAIPNDNLDDTKAIQNTIDFAGKSGGGTVLFPKGKFHVNSDTSKLDIVKINYSNVVLRGAGSKIDGTVIYSGSSTTQREGNSPWLSPFVFHSGLNLHGTNNFYSVREEPVFANIIKGIPKGESRAVLSTTKGLKPGDILIVAMQNTLPEGDLMNELMAPLKFDHFQTSYINAGKNKDASFQYPMEIKEVIDHNTVVFCQPFRREIKLEFKPFVTRMAMLKNIGIEHFRFESSWSGEYSHHGTREMDYGWGAVCLHRVSHGWIKDVAIDNYTQSTHLVNSRNVTITNVVITGGEGHYGPKMYASCDNLVKNIRVEAKRTHGPGLEGCSFGNVYKDIDFKYSAPIDLHGISDAGFCPPMYNLYENISNISRIAGGGAPQNIPHAGEYNTFWNIEMQGWEDGNYSEVFYSWIWRDTVRFDDELHIDCHKQYLRSIIVNTIPIKKNLSIEHATVDRFDKWIYVEKLNSINKAASLYEYQLNLRLKQ